MSNDLNTFFQKVFCPSLCAVWLSWLLCFGLCRCCPDVVHRWGLVGCCVACAVAVGGLLVRPSVWLSWWLWWACFGVVSCRCLLFRCGFGLPLPFWGVLLPFLAVFGGGVVCLLVRCFSWQFGAFNGFVWWLLCFRLVVGYPFPIFGECMGGRITPSKFPKKFFPLLGWKGRSSGFFKYNILTGIEI